nr:hypothetical protein [Aeromonas veronii]
MATALKDHGVPLQYAAAILGHTNGAISERKFDPGYILDGFLLQGKKLPDYQCRSSATLMQLRPDDLAV